VKPKSARLGTVLTLEMRNKRQAEQLLAEQLKRVQNDEQQLVLLEDYLKDYQRQYNEACAQGISPLSMQTFHGFMAKINSTIEQHRQAMLINRQQLERVRAHVIKVQGRFKAVESLVDKARDQEQLAADKALQKMLDERAQFSRSQSLF